MIYLVDSAGARITDQVAMFPGRRHAGRIFFNEVRMSGVVPQVCVLFGPSAAGGAYIPAFCDIVIMREGNASMYLGSPRMAGDGDRREGDARGDGRREAPHRHLRGRAPARQDRRGGHRPREGLPLVLPGLVRRRGRLPARWLIAGLTFQLAADIIETSITTDWEAIARVAAIAVIRTFLNYFLERDFAELSQRKQETR